MDAFFFFLVPKESDLSLFNFQIPLFKWQGADYPQGPPECMFGPDFKLRFADENLYANIIKSKLSLLPEKYKYESWQFIEVLGEGIHIYHNALHGDERKEYAEYSLKKLIERMLSNKSKWAVGFECHYDDGFQVSEGKIGDVMLEMNNSLKGINKAGFLLYSNT